MKRWIPNIAASVVAVVVGLGAMWASAKGLKQPEGLLDLNGSLDWNGVLDWTVLLLSGVTTGTLAFFVIWGHFQGDPRDRVAGEVER